MKRGEIWTVAGFGEYTGKPRPVVLVQDDLFSETTSVTVCAFTTHGVDAPILRIPILPTKSNGLKVASSLMVDKLTTVPKAKLGTRVGRLDRSDLVRLNRAIAVFLGLAASER